MNAQWLQNEIIPQAIKLGVIKIAIFMDPDVFKQFYIQNIEKTKDIKENALMKHFDSVEEANAWLKEG
jgi:hypothetical protein